MGSLTPYIDSDGRVTVWVDGKWKRLCPVDAREQINLGIATLKAPEDAPPKPEPPVIPEAIDVALMQIAELRGHAEKLGVIGVEAMDLDALRQAIKMKSKAAEGQDALGDVTEEELRDRARAMGIANVDKLGDEDLRMALEPRE